MIYRWCLIHTPCYHLKNFARSCIQIHYRISLHLPNKQYNCCSSGSRWMHFLARWLIFHWGYRWVSYLVITWLKSLLFLLFIVLLCWVGISLFFEKSILVFMLKSTSTTAHLCQGLPVPALGDYFFCAFAILG